MDGRIGPKFRGHAEIHGPPIWSEFLKGKAGIHEPPIRSQFLKGEEGIHGPPIWFKGSTSQGTVKCCIVRITEVPLFLIVFVGQILTCSFLCKNKFQGLLCKRSYHPSTKLADPGLRETDYTIHINTILLPSSGQILVNLILVYTKSTIAFSTRWVLTAVKNLTSR